MRPRKKIGEMLIEADLITRSQLDRAVEEAIRASMKIGEYLVARGIVSETQITETLSQQLGVSLYRPDKYPINQQLASLITPEIAQKHRVVPLAQEPHLLIVGMVDPLDIQAMDLIEDLTRMEVEPVVCTTRQINQLFSSMYGVSLGLDGILASIDIDDGTPPDPIDQDEEIKVSSLIDLAEGAPVVRMVNWMIAEAVREGASDVHISPERNFIQLRFRVDGRLREMPAPPKNMLLSIISRIKILAHMDIAISRIPQDGRFTTRIENREINVRASAIPTINGENIVLRLLDMSATVYTLDSLGMSADSRAKIEALIEKPYGMILSTGPTGSGKTTSLYAILRELNRPDVNIITVEDPVEYRVEKIRQLQLNRKAGMTFASGLRSILRQDPDVIMVGEIRDPETARIAVQAALTGHRVLSTAHTNDAAGAITRLMDMGIEPFLVSSVLLVSFAQRLVRRACESCRIELPAEQDILEFWGIENKKKITIFRAGGCQECRDTGYRGRIAVYEILTVTDQIKELIARRAPLVEITRVARETTGFRTLREDVADKIAGGITTLEEAMSVVMQ